MLDQLCGLLPSPTNATCKYFVDEYVRDFITHFHVEFDPAVVCSLLGVCSQNPVTAHGQCSLYDIALCMILVNVYTAVPRCMLVCVYYLLLCVDVHGATNSRVLRCLLESSEVFWVKFSGHGKSWKMILVLKSPGNLSYRSWKVLEFAGTWTQ